MQILLNIDELADVTNDGWEEHFSTEEERRIVETLQLENVEELARVNIGPGADLMVILLSINAIADTYLVASKILEGSAGWKKLISKIKQFINKRELVSVDEDGAKILAIDFLTQHYQYERNDLISSQVINITDVSGLIRLSSELAKRPHNYYIQAYCLDNEKKIILGITSDGEVKLIKAYGWSPYGLNEQED